MIERIKRIPDKIKRMLDKINLSKLHRQLAWYKDEQQRLVDEQHRLVDEQHRFVDEQHRLVDEQQRLVDELSDYKNESYQLVATISWHNDERFQLIDYYLTLMEKCLTGTIYEDPPLKALGAEKFDPKLREYGWDWPSVAHTMIGKKRLNNVRKLTESVLGNGVEGDFIETGVWRGGACIMIRAVLKAYSIKDRCVWLADSFEGLPRPDAEKYPSDAGDEFHSFADLSVTLEQVMLNFEKYDLLDNQVKFLTGWFKDTLPEAPIQKLALLRLDGDMYESTMDALQALYDKVSVGGFVIVDDYHVVEGCKQAVHDFLSERNLTPILEEIDGVGVFWRVL